MLGVVVLKIVGVPLSIRGRDTRPNGFAAAAGGMLMDRRLRAAAGLGGCVTCLIHVGP